MIHLAFQMATCESWEVLWGNIMKLTYPVPQNVRLLLLAALGLIIVLYSSGRLRSDVQVLDKLLVGRIALLRFRL